MRPDGVVVLAPLLDEDLGLFEAAEDFAIEELVPELRVEALANHHVTLTHVCQDQPGRFATCFSHFLPPNG